MRLGMIVRGDNGGLGTQTWEIARHTHPDSVLLVDMGDGGRGLCDQSRFDGLEITVVRHVPGHGLDVGEVARWLAPLDRVFAAESFYGPQFVALAHGLDVEVILQANPELYTDEEQGGARIVLPTPWESHRVPHERVLPVPVARDRFPEPAGPRPAGRIFTLYHPGAPAMLDRNGTALVEDALPFVQKPCRVVIRDHRVRRPQNRREGLVEVTRLPPVEGPYWETTPPDADALLLPRRYGGLCLPMQEAAAQGLPVITLDLPPQDSYPFTLLVEPTINHRQYPMKGGLFDVWGCAPHALAAAIDQLVDDPTLHADLSTEAWHWAKANDWDRWAGDYQEVLRG